MKGPMTKAQGARPKAQGPRNLLVAQPLVVALALVIGPWSLGLRKDGVFAADL
jgi:hypothetical protein